MKKKDTWIYKVFFMSFLLAAIFSTASSYFAEAFNDVILTLIVLVVMLIGIIFDIIGVSVLTADESVYHAKAAQKVKGAKESVTLIKNASQVSNFCNDVIGDICGIVSGGLGTVLALSLAIKSNVNPMWLTIGIASLTSSLTVGFKAVGKKIALKKCDNIVFAVGKLKNFLNLK